MSRALPQKGGMDRGGGGTGREGAGSGEGSGKRGGGKRGERGREAGREGEGRGEREGEGSKERGGEKRGERGREAEIGYPPVHPHQERGAPRLGIELGVQSAPLFISAMVINGVFLVKETVQHGF